MTALMIARQTAVRRYGGMVGGKETSMHAQSPNLDAAIRAMNGEGDLEVVLPALEIWSLDVLDEDSLVRDLAPVLAMAPDVHPVVGAIAALRCGWTSLLPPGIIADAALSAAIQRLIGTPEGAAVLMAWATIAPAAWGRPLAATLRDAVARRTCFAGAAAALIGPCDESAALLTHASEIAFALRHWGQSLPNAPIAWADAISAGERQRLIDVVLSSSSHAASCLPWAPPNAANQAHIDTVDLGAALDAFAEASPSARAMHAGIVQQLVARAHPEHLGALTRLAAATDAEDIRRRIRVMLNATPYVAEDIVIAAPWNDLPEDVRDDIAILAPRSNACRTIVAARGSMAWTPDAVYSNAFFAALDAEVWDALGVVARRAWLQELAHTQTHLAVRSLGLRPEILARATLDANLVHAAHRHARDEDALRAALFPVALRRHPSAVAHALIAAMATLPPDHGAFVAIAGGSRDPDGIAPARSALRTPADLALAVAIQRCMHDGASVRTRCAALRDVLHERTWDDLAPIMPLLDAATRAVLMAAADTIAEELAHPDRQDFLRQTLERLAALPPAVAIPTRVALHCWMAESGEGFAVAETLAVMLRAHGDVFLNIADALADDLLRDMLLPPSEHPPMAAALRALAQDDPVTAQRLAHALRVRAWRQAFDALCALDARHVASILEGLKTDDDPLVHADAAWAGAIADQGRADDVHALWQRIARLHPLAAIAIRAWADDHFVHPVADRAASAETDPVLALLAHHEPIVRMIAPLLSDNARRRLRSHPAIDIVIADQHANAATRRCIPRTRRRSGA